MQEERPTLPSYPLSYQHVIPQLEKWHQQMYHKYQITLIYWIFSMIGDISKYHQ